MLPRLSLFIILSCFINNALLAKTPIVEQPAHFYSHSKAYKQALLYLFEIDNAGLSTSGQALQQKLMQQLNLVSTSVLGNDNDCMLAIQSVGSKKGVYHLTVCLVETGDKSLSKALQVDNAITKLLDEQGRNENDQWLAYAYYNLAVYAVSLGDGGQANLYFDKALNFIQASPEGKGLYNRIWLERAYAEYYSNQFAAAMDAFEHVGLDSAFKSEALLGYGWAAFYSYERGLALEAWRQVAFEKSKSMSVYEALIAIPFALEKANAFSGSLTAYENAISEYEKALKQIEDLQKNLTLADVQSYVAGDKQGVPEMLPELLGVAFTRKNFRTLIDEAMALREQEFVLKQQLQQLQDIQQVVAMNQAQASADSSQAIAKSKEQLATLTRKIDLLRVQFVGFILGHPKASDYLKKLVYQYQQLQRLASSNNKAVQSKLNGLQIILLINAYYEDVLSKDALQGLTSLMKEKRFLEGRINGIEETQAMLALSPGVRQARFTELQQRISDLQQRQERHALAIQEKLLQMTQDQLANYKQQIIGFSKQARIASARLQEEFYQLGGHE